jgi:hypothetical protein
VAYCVVCYLVTALLFSLLILDLAALVITVAPSKAIFKYTDLVYTGEQQQQPGSSACLLTCVASLPFCLGACQHTECPPPRPPKHTTHSPPH